MITYNEEGKWTRTRSLSSSIPSSQECVSHEVNLASSYSLLIRAWRTIGRVSL